jgi:hypothetical protein
MPWTSALAVLGKFPGRVFMQPDLEQVWTAALCARSPKGLAMQLCQDCCVLSVNIVPYAVGRCGRRSSCAAMSGLAHSNSPSGDGVADPGQTANVLIAVQQNLESLACRAKTTRLVVHVWECVQGNRKSFRHLVQGPACVFGAGRVCDAAVAPRGCALHAPLPQPRAAGQDRRSRAGDPPTLTMPAASMALLVVINLVNTVTASP